MSQNEELYVYKTDKCKHSLHVAGPIVVAKGWLKLTSSNNCSVFIIYILVVRFNNKELHKSEQV